MRIFTYKQDIMDFSKIRNDELLAIIKNDENHWQGTQNGDSIERYQGRQCFVYAAALILFGREMESGEAILTTEQAADIFFNKMRYLLNQGYIDGESGTSRFCAEVLLNRWKRMFESRNLPDSRHKNTKL